MSIYQDNERRIRESIQGTKSKARPFKLFLNFPVIAPFNNISIRDYFGDPKLQMEAQIKTYEALGLTGPLSPDVGIVTECNAMGCEVLYNHMGFTACKGFDDLELDELMARTKVADPWGGSLMTTVLEYLDYMVKNAPEGWEVEPCGVFGPITVASQYRGMTEFFTDIYEEPEMIKELLSITTDTLIAFNKEMEKIMGKPLTHILIFDDNVSFLNPDMYREFAMPCYDKLYNAFPSAERWMHNDANALHIASLIAESGFKFWHTGTCMDITELAKLTEGKVSLCGNLSPLEEVKNGTPEDVKKACEKQLAAFGDNPKYILGLGGFAPYGASIDNLKAIIDAAVADHY